MTPRETINEGNDAVARKTKVRTTIEPGIVIEVDAAELVDLDRQGLIKSREGDDNWKGEEPDEIEALKGELEPEPKTSKKGA